MSVVIITSLLNTYYLVLWLFMFNTYDNFTDRHYHFIKYLLITNNITILNLTLLGLTLLTLYLIPRTLNNNSFYKYLLNSLHSFFLVTVLISYI